MFYGGAVNWLQDKNDRLRLRRLRKWIATIDHHVIDLFVEAEAIRADWVELRQQLSGNASDLDYEREIRAFLDELEEIP